MGGASGWASNLKSMGPVNRTNAVLLNPSRGGGSGETVRGDGSADRQSQRDQKEQ